MYGYKHFLAISLGVSIPAVILLTIILVSIICGHVTAFKNNRKTKKHVSDWDTYDALELDGILLLLLGIPFLAFFISIMLFWFIPTPIGMDIIYKTEEGEYISIKHGEILTYEKNSRRDIIDIEHGKSYPIGEGLGHIVNLGYHWEYMNKFQIMKYWEKGA